MLNIFSCFLETARAVDLATIELLYSRLSINELIMSSNSITIEDIQNNLINKIDSLGGNTEPLRNFIERKVALCNSKLSILANINHSSPFGRYAAARLITTVWSIRVATFSKVSNNLANLDQSDKYCNIFLKAQKGLISDRSKLMTELEDHFKVAGQIESCTSRATSICAHLESIQDSLD